MNKRTRDYYLGRLVGEYIVSNTLPTLSTDMLKTRQVIQVSEEETIKHKLLSSNWLEASKTEESENEYWKPLLDYTYYLAKKYLPKELISRVPKFGLEFVEDMKDFKNGIRHTLWDSDVCWYNIDFNDNIEIQKTDDNSWCEIIKLQLKIDNLTNL